MSTVTRLLPTLAINSQLLRDLGHALLGNSHYEVVQFVFGCCTPREP